MNLQSHSRIKLLTGTSLIFILACNVSFNAGMPTVIPTTVVPTNTNLPPAETFTPISAPIEVYTAIPTLPVSLQVTLTSLPINETNPDSSFPPYTITAQIPQLTGSDDPRVLAFNQQLNDLLTKEIDTWRQSFQQLPITPITNGSSLDLRYTLISQIGDLWSFKFDFGFYSDGAAHPGMYSITLTYDLGQGRELALSDLFLPNSNYLEAIATYCAAELGKQPYADSFFLEGANPIPENYLNWNITPDGLLITFDEYQVAPYAAGPQQVTVPYSELTSVINPQGPLAIVIVK